MWPQSTVNTVKKLGEAITDRRKDTHSHVIGDRAHTQFSFILYDDDDDDADEAEFYTFIYPKYVSFLAARKWIFLLSEMLVASPAVCVVMAP